MTDTCTKIEPIQVCDYKLIREIIVNGEDEPDKMTWYEAMELENSTWRLPTISELDMIYKSKDEIGGFKDCSYWSSSESSDTGALGQRFSDGFQYNTRKSYTYAVRLVRR